MRTCVELFCHCNCSRLASVLLLASCHLPAPPTHTPSCHPGCLPPHCRWFELLSSFIEDGPSAPALLAMRRDAAVAGPGSAEWAATEVRCALPHLGDGGGQGRVGVGLPLGRAERAVQHRRAPNWGKGCALPHFGDGGGRCRLSAAHGGQADSKACAGAGWMVVTRARGRASACHDPATTTARLAVFELEGWLRG